MGKEGVKYRKRRVRKQEVHRSTQEMDILEWDSVRVVEGMLKDRVRGEVRVKIILEQHPHKDSVT